MTSSGTPAQVTYTAQRSYGETKKERQYNRYVRFGVPHGERPLVLRRIFHHFQAEYLELDQQFRLFHNLFEENKTGAFFDFEAADRLIEVARIADDEVTVLSDYVMRYLAARKMRLVIFIDYAYKPDIPPYGSFPAQHACRPARHSHDRNFGQ